MKDSAGNMRWDYDCLRAAYDAAFRAWCLQVKAGNETREALEAYWESRDRLAKFLIEVGAQKPMRSAARGSWA
jgi:hypothetical protein